MNRFLGVTTEILSKTQPLWDLIPPNFASPFVHTWATAVFPAVQDKEKALPSCPPRLLQNAFFLRKDSGQILKLHFKTCPDVNSVWKSAQTVAFHWPEEKPLTGIGTIPK